MEHRQVLNRPRFSGASMLSSRRAPDESCCRARKGAGSSAEPGQWWEPESLGLLYLQMEQLTKSFIPSASTVDAGLANWGALFGEWDLAPLCSWEQTDAHQPYSFRVARKAGHGARFNFFFFLLL